MPSPAPLQLFHRSSLTSGVEMGVSDRVLLFRLGPAPGLHLCSLCYTNTVLWRLDSEDLGQEMVLLAPSGIIFPL